MLKYDLHQVAQTSVKIALLAYWLVISLNIRTLSVFGILISSGSSALLNTIFFGCTLSIFSDKYYLTIVSVCYSLFVLFGI